MSKNSSNDSKDKVAFIDQYGDAYQMNRKGTIDFLTLWIKNQAVSPAGFGRKIDDDTKRNLDGVVFYSLDALTVEKAQVLLDDADNGGGPWG